MKLLYTIALWMFTTVAMAADIVWIDVRSAAEYQSGHKEGAINIPHTEIVAGVEKLQLAKDAEINLYCRSGRRADAALSNLQQSGYTHVNNIGGLTDALNYSGAD